MKAKIEKLKDLIKVQEGSVVSKTLIKKLVGTVTLFAFDAGEALSTHSASYDAMVQVLEGSVKIVISGKQYILKSGDMIIMPANEPHSLEALTKFKFLLTMIKE